MTRLDLLLAVALGSGVALRVIHFANGRSLWIDEARLAVTIASRSYTTLLEPLDYDQVAPPLFLWAEKLATQLLGVSEPALRLLPLLAGLASLFLLYPTARRLLGPPASVVVAAMGAVGPFLVYYSGEVKQYAVDVLVTLALVNLLVDWIENPGSRRKALRLAGMGAVSVWLSATSVFVLCGVGLAALVHRWRLGPAARLQVVALGALWASALLAAHLLLYRHSTGNVYLQWFWSAGFLQGPAALRHDWLAIRDVLCGLIAGWSTEWPLSTLQDLGADALAVAVLAVFAVGCRQLVRRHGWWPVALLGGGVGSAAAASALQVYPLGIRTMLYSAPLLLLAFAAGLEPLWHPAAPRWRRRLTAGVVSGLLLAALVLGVGRSVTTSTWSRMETAAERFEANHKPGEPVYVFAGALPAWLFYTTDWTAPDTARLSFYARVGRSDGPAFENALSREGPVVDEGAGLVYRSADRVELLGVPSGVGARYLVGPSRRQADPEWIEHEARRVYGLGAPVVWLVFTHYYGFEPTLVYALDLLGGKRTYNLQASGVLLFRYEFSDTGRAGAGAAPSGSQSGRP